MNDINLKKINKNLGYYLPLFNMRGLVSSITPYFSGDLKLGYYNYVLKPVTEVDLYNLSDKRNIYFYIDGKRYDWNGQLPWQLDDEIQYGVNQLSQKVIRKSSIYEIKTLSFVPVDDLLEVHRITYTNVTNSPQKINVVTAIPFYSRSPETIHDHRHVTSLLNRVTIFKNGIVNFPTLSFDERGHKENKISYGVFAYSEELKIKGYIPTLDEFINKGTTTFPLGDLRDTNYQIGDNVCGYEAFGGIQFEEKIVQPKESITIKLTIGLNDSVENLLVESEKYQKNETFLKEYNAMLENVKEMNDYIDFKYESNEKSEQLKWVTLQPVLRRFLGNSYLPHHDYGHGGRGWRDLWQDLLALIFSADETVRNSIFDNFAGVRIDGSNATIIGQKSGEFKADRNQIVRVWSDHGAWPLLTVKMYIDETNDLNLLFSNQVYFDDKFSHYTKKTKKNASEDNILTINQKHYKGTVLEHLILQNIVGYLNIGEKGFTRLEDADWNDGLDMANNLGETIPFTMFYLNNLRVICDLLNHINEEKITIFSSLEKLILGEYSLENYFDAVSTLKGLEKVEVDKKILISNFEKYIENKEKHIKKYGVINNNHFHSYVNNDGDFLDTDETVSLTAQTMALLNNIPSPDFAKNIADFTREKLFDVNVGGYRLNSNYGKIMLNMGRAYGFAYGHKENGAVFSHMATMYAYGLYNYDLVKEGNEAINTLLNRAMNKDSHVLAGVPEYFNDQGVGKYSFLTGTASWLIKLLRDQIFGIKLQYGVLELKPKLMNNDFIDGIAKITTYVFNNKTTIVYHNTKKLEYGEYKVTKILIDGYETNERKFTSIGKMVEVFLDEND